MKWIMNIPEDQYRLTVEFWQSRPLSREEKTHPHGAWDIAPIGSAEDSYSRSKAGLGVGFYAPEDGQVVFFAAFRPNVSRGMGEFGRRLPREFFDIKNHFYFYDAYGALVILKGVSGMVHVFTHSWLNQLFNLTGPYLESRQRAEKEGTDESRTRGMERFKTTEATGNDDSGRWPLTALSNLHSPFKVQEGELIGGVGNAGFSTGRHIHYEIHDRSSWQEHRNRIDPKDIYPEVWETHKDDHRRFYNYEEHRERWQ